MNIYVCVCVPSHFSHVQLFATLLIVAYKAPLSMRFFRQEYWGALLFPSPRDLPDPGIKPESLMSSALAGGFFTTSIIKGAQYINICIYMYMYVCVYIYTYAHIYIHI